MRKTALIETYGGSDRVLLARLGLLGPFYEVPEYLFLSRSHAEQSVRSSRYDRMWWFNPAKQGKLALPTWRIFGELLKAPLEARLSTASRIACLADASSWPFKNGNGIEMAVDLVRAARHVLHVSARPPGQADTGRDQDGPADIG